MGVYRGFISGGSSLSPAPRGSAGRIAVCHLRRVGPERVATPPARRRWARTRRIAPWLVATAILGVLFWKVPIAESWRAVREARLELFLPAVLAAVTFWFWIESGAFAYLFSRFNAPLSWAEARSLRGTTYLLTPINWNAATAGVVFHLRHSKQVGALESTSSILFYSLIDGLVLAGLALVALWLLPASPEVASFRRLALGAELLLVGMLALFMAPAPAWSWLARLRGLALFRTHALAAPRDVACLVLLRGLYFSVFGALFAVGTHAFGAPVPALVATASVPPILMAAALPITPAGLGTQQAVMLYFWSPYGEEAALLAFGLAFPVAVTLSRCLLGLRYLRDLGGREGSSSPHE